MSYDSQGYLYPGTKNHYHSIVSVYNIIHDQHLESVTYISYPDLLSICASEELELQEG